MRKSTLHRIAIVVVAVALGSAVIATDAVAAGGNAAGHGGGGMGGGHFGGATGGSHFDGDAARRLLTTPGLCQHSLLAL